MRSRSVSIAGRALLAVLLTIGFYGLALAIVALLLFIPYAEMRFAERLHFRLALACLLGAFAILWSILPRRDRFEPPGPRLEAAEHPCLFEEVHTIAQKTEQQMPADVYVIPDINAFVAERGGFMGLGSRRVMGVGLPLLGILTVPQFQAVVAHEFGHFYGGDTKLGPWIYKTRTAIIRTIMSLGRESWLRIPFQWYAKLFLRLTNAVSRHQEHVADELAARMVGARPLEEGLRAIHGVAPAYEAFWQNEFGPILNAQHRPPLVEGFVHFTRTPTVSEAMKQVVAKEMESPETSPYDTHPSLPQRIAALAGVSPGPVGSDGAVALSLLNDVPKLERQLLVHMFGESKVRALKTLDWQEVGMAVLLPQWEELVGRHGTALAGLTAASLSDFLRSPEPLVEQLKHSKQWISLTPEQRKNAIVGITGRALSLALVRQGWKLEAPPGEEVSLRGGAATIQPFTEIKRLSSGELTAEAWQQRCEQAGIAGLDLAEPVPQGS